MNKRIAVCFAGIPNCAKYGQELMKNFYKGFDIDYYIHAWGDSDTEAEVRRIFNPVSVKVEPLRDWTNHLKVVPDMSQTTKNISHTISPLFSIKCVGELLELSSRKYDYAILTRTDIANIANKPLIEKIRPNIVYSSYVNGSIWNLRRNDPGYDNVIDTKLLCMDKETLIYFTKLFDKLDEYLGEDRKPFCHHRLFYHHLRNIDKPMEMINMDEADLIGGWRWIRNNALSLY
jgi:hypothetical protein